MFAGGGKNYSYATAPGLGAARPRELCGLRIRPRTDVDPPRSAGGISSRRAITCFANDNKLNDDDDDYDQNLC